MASEKRLFFRTWLTRPLQIGAPIPSSSFLAHAMAAQLPLEVRGYIVELGGGTGIITKGLIQAGVPEECLIIIEREPHFHTSLAKYFPKATVLLGDAEALPELLRLEGIEEVAAIVSSLPLLSMPVEQRKAILEAGFQVLQEKAPFIQYTYGLHSPIPRRILKEMKLHAEGARRIWQNFPPARIWEFTRDRESYQPAIHHDTGSSFH